MLWGAGGQQEKPSMARAPAKPAEKAKIPIAYVAHQTRKRTRLSIPEHRGNGSVLGAIAQQLREHPEVIAVDVIELTASIIIAHEVEPETILKFCKDLGLFHLGDSDDRGAHRTAIHSNINLQTVLFGALAALSLVHFVVARNSLSVISLVLATAGLAVSHDAEHHSHKLQHLQRRVGAAGVIESGA
jgi:hypothetical protein